MNANKIKNPIKIEHTIAHRKIKILILASKRSYSKITVAKTAVSAVLNIIIF